jgi:hypothetical protein
MRIIRLINDILNATNIYALLIDENVLQLEIDTSYKVCVNYTMKIVDRIAHNTDLYFIINHRALYNTGFHLHYYPLDNKIIQIETQKKDGIRVQLSSKIIYSDVILYTSINLYKYFPLYLYPIVIYRSNNRIIRKVEDEDIRSYTIEYRTDYNPHTYSSDVAMRMNTQCCVEYTNGYEMTSALIRWIEGIDNIILHHTEETTHNINSQKQMDYETLRRQIYKRQLCNKIHKEDIYKEFEYNIEHFLDF